MTRWTLEFAPYRVPLRRPFRTAHGLVESREGLLVRLRAPGGDEGLGEAAPVPGDPGDAVRGLANRLRELAPALLEQVAGRGARLRGDAVLPLPIVLMPGTGAADRALACAVDTAWWDMAASAARMPLAAAWADDVALPVHVNAIVDAAETAEAAERARAAANAGFTSLKLKAGAGDPTDDETRVRVVREAVGGGVLLRLDANGAWTRDVAAAALVRLARYDIELVEQPLPPDDLPAMAELRRVSPIPLAADEAVTGEARAREILALGAADVLVLKLSRLGGPTAALQVAAAARETGAPCIVTTAFEAGPALAAALHLAAALPRSGPAHGLATGGLLERVLVAPWSDEDAPRLSPPAGPGLGVRLTGIDERDWRPLSA